jgi:hypothetical protein
MNLGWGMGILAATLLGGIASWQAVRPEPALASLVVSHAGRDQALIQLLQRARKSVYLRTEDLTLVPAGNELAQAIQRKVSVTVELPLDAGLSPVGSRLPRLLMGLGAVVSFRSDPAWNYRGTYLEIDGARFLYSASPLILNPPGALVSYVAGPIHWKTMGIL